jgi:hypothetical protein
VSTTVVGPEVPPEWAQAFQGVRWGRLTDGHGWTYQFTTADARWAVPAIVGESSRDDDREAILQTMANRLYLAKAEPVIVGRGDNQFPTSYFGVLRTYCQPVNPYWVDTGALEQRARRARMQSDPPEAFSQGAFDLVLAWMTGELVPQARYRDVVHFADCECSPGCGRDVHGPEKFSIGGQCYWSSATWPRDVALRVIEAPARPTTKKSSMLVPVLAGAGLTALALLLGSR